MTTIPTTYNKKDNTWSGAKSSSIFDYDTSVGRIIFNTMKNYPKIVVQVSNTSDKNFKIILNRYKL